MNLLTRKLMSAVHTQAMKNLRVSAITALKKLLSQLVFYPQPLCSYIEREFLREYLSYKCNFFFCLKYGPREI